MTKVAILVVEQQMVDYANELIRDFNLDIIINKTIDTVNTVNEARAAISAGAEIIIARGYQAKIIKQFTDIPVVEICLTAQEIGMLINESKHLSGKIRPHILLTAFDNMLPDLTHMEDLFGVDLDIVYIESDVHAENVLSLGGTDDYDVIIGGNIVCNAASRLGIPSLFYHCSSESITAAIKSAEGIAFAMETRQESNAQLETLLEASVNGIIRINHNHNINMVNQMAELMLDKDKEAVIGQSLYSIIPEIDKAEIDKILTNEKQNFTISINIHNKGYILLVSPIVLGNRPEGAILSFRNIESLSPDSLSKNRSLRSTFTTAESFENFIAKSPKMIELISKAKLFALSSLPILVRDQVGSISNTLAKCIHNASPRRTAPFVSIDILNLSDEEQVNALFGYNYLSDSHLADSSRQPGALQKANTGTLLIYHAECLNIRAQSLLLRTLMPWSTMHNDSQPVNILNVRLILLSEHDLSIAVSNKTFLKDLYYKICTLPLYIPPLNECPEDIVYHFTERISHYNKQYNKYLHISAGAKDFITTLDWSGNMLQLDAFCENLVLTATKRKIDEITLRLVYDNLYPNVLITQNRETVVIYDSSEAEKIRGLLEKYHGRRGDVATELGISTTTLWRRMKKLGIK